MKDTSRGHPEDDIPMLRNRMVDELIVSNRIRSSHLAAAFRTVPRHIFLPDADPTSAYRDEAIVTKWAADGRPVSSSSQPAVMAAMLEQLDAQTGQSVLEVGAGTGYNAALLAQLVGASGAVTTIDIDEDLVEQARRNLRAAGADGISVVHADGAEGWPRAAPFDRIILTAAAWDLAPAWLEQLADGGRLVLPLSLRGVQRSVALERVSNYMASVSIVGCGFMPLRGSFAGPDPVRPLGDEPGLFLELDDERPLNLGALSAALEHLGDEMATSVTVTPAEIMGGLGLWLALHDSDAGRLITLGEGLNRRLVPAVVAFPGMALTPVLVGDQALAALIRLNPAAAGTDAFEVGVRTYGPDGDDLADRLVAHVREWEAAGRPSTTGLRIRAYPAAESCSGPFTALIDKYHTRLLLDWQPPATGPGSGPTHC